MEYKSLNSVVRGMLITEEEENHQLLDEAAKDSHALRKIAVKEAKQLVLKVEDMWIPDVDAGRYEGPSGQKQYAQDETKRIREFKLVIKHLVLASLASSR